MSCLFSETLLIFSYPHQHGVMVNIICSFRSIFGVY